MQATLLVTGASGQLGRRVLELLLDANAGKIIATTRTPDKLQEFAAKGVIVRQADFNDPDSLVKAFEGADRLLLISTDTIGVRIQQHTNAVKAAEKAGVKHIVYTSLVNPEPGSPVAIAPEHYATEQALQASGLGWTSLRNNLYLDLSVGTFQQAAQSGTLMNAIGDGKVAYITREDCARAAAAALADNFEGQRTLDVAGATSISQPELAAIISKLSGKPVNYVPADAANMTGILQQVGLPQPVAEMLVSFDVAASQGYLDTPSTAVEDLTGTPAMSVEAFLSSVSEALTV